jgi:hypothetical protein
MPDYEPFELEQTDRPFHPAHDPRPKMPEPLPVRLVAVADVILPATAGLECELDEFYVAMLEFARDQSLPYELVYRADNFRLVFQLHEGLVRREEYRPLQVEVQSLIEAERKLIDRELEYIRQRGLQPGSRTLLLNDPAGNFVELVESRRVML